MENNNKETEVIDELPDNVGDAREVTIKKVISDFKAGLLKLSPTSLSEFMRSPRDFITYKMGDKKSTKSMDFGTIVHCLILEPSKFDERYSTDTDIVNEIGGKARATNRYRDWVADKEKAGICIISHEDYVAAQAMATAVLNNPAAKRQLDRISSTEVHIEFTYNGFIIKGFIDGEGTEVILDIKTCADAEPVKFHKDISNMGYWFKMGMYWLSSNKEKEVYLIAVDKRLGVSTFLIEEDWLEFAARKIDKALRDFESCVETNNFNSSFEYRAPTEAGHYIAIKPNWLT